MKRTVVVVVICGQWANDPESERLTSACRLHVLCPRSPLFTALDKREMERKIEKKQRMSGIKET